MATKKTEMKDYIKAKIWANEIASMSTDLDLQIEYYQRDIDRYKKTIETDGESEYYNEMIAELYEKIECREWALKTINAPFKIK